jgi:hypothetical protein
LAEEAVRVKTVVKEKKKILNPATWSETTLERHRCHGAMRRKRREGEKKNISIGGTCSGTPCSAL